MTNTIQFIPLNKLEIAECNVRKTAADEGIDDLMASIAAHGLLQSLVVQRGRRGKHDVIAGGRRLRALKALAKSRVIAADLAIPCKLIANDADAGELSLAENIVRAPMHPGDQFEAFCAVIDQGKSIADVAARFNVSEGLIHQRLKLGRLSQAILQAYREDRIDLEQAQAFAVADDHAEQERVLVDLGEGAHPQRIRAALTHGEVPSSDKRVRYIGEAAYCAAGGTVRRDLFNDEDSFYVLDEALLEKLVAKKLATVEAQVKAEGWQWVGIDLDADYSTFAAFTRLYPEHAKLPKKVRKQLDALGDEYDALVDSLEDSDDAEAQARLEDIQRRIDALQPAEIWPADTLASCGAIITLEYEGDVRIEKGLMKRADARRRKAGEQVASSDNLPAASPFSAALVEDLTAHKTAAIRAELERQPDIALAAIVHALLARLWYADHQRASCLKLSAISPALPIKELTSALQSLERSREHWADQLPAEENDAWQWCLTQTRDTHLELLAYLAACMVDAVQHKDDHDDAHLQHADALARALNVDMNAWYTPTADGFFRRISRKAILSVIDEAKGSHGPALEKLGKTDLAKRAAQLIQGSGWLPGPVRVSTDVQTGSLPKAAE